MEAWCCNQCNLWTKVENLCPICHSECPDITPIPNIPWDDRRGYYNLHERVLKDGKAEWVRMGSTQDQVIALKWSSHHLKWGEDTEIGARRYTGWGPPM